MDIAGARTPDQLRADELRDLLGPLMRFSEAWRPVRGDGSPRLWSARIVLFHAIDDLVYVLRVLRGDIE
jgi:hypothetical protein